MMFAQAEKVDILYDHHFVILFGKHCAVENFFNILIIPLREEIERPCDAAGGPAQPLSIRVLTDTEKDRFDCILESWFFGHDQPRYSAKLLGVSYTLIEWSLPEEILGERILQNAVARFSAVGMRFR